MSGAASPTAAVFNGNKTESKDKTFAWPDPRWFCLACNYYISNKASAGGSTVSSKPIEESTLSNGQHGDKANVTNYDGCAQKMKFHFYAHISTLKLFHGA